MLSAFELWCTVFFSNKKYLTVARFRGPSSCFVIARFLGGNSLGYGLTLLLQNLTDQASRMTYGSLIKKLILGPYCSAYLLA